MYYLQLTGYVPEHKQMEFEQTYRLATLQIPKTCSRYYITKDVLNDCMYHFITYWPVLKSLESFSKSDTFCLMTGAFITLGELHENARGEIKEQLT